MKTLLVVSAMLVVSATGLIRPSLNRNFDPNEIQVVGIPDPNMTYDQVMAGYLGLDAFEKVAFKMQIGYMEDSSYIVYMNKNTKTIHRHDCRYVNDNCVPVLRSSVIAANTEGEPETVKPGYKICSGCKP